MTQYRKPTCTLCHKEGHSRRFCPDRPKPKRPGRTPRPKPIPGIAVRGYDQDLAVIGAQMGLSGERVRQIEEQALRKLRRALRDVELDADPTSGSVPESILSALPDSLDPTEES